MARIAFAGTILDIDVERTRQIYATIEHCGPMACDCSYCRNFAAQLPDLFPPDVLTFFEAAGIDPAKAAEVYEVTESRPGFRLYGGEYYFIGKLPQTSGNGRLAAGFEFTFSAPTPLVQPAFRGVSDTCRFGFLHEVAWLLGQ